MPILSIITLTEPSLSVSSFIHYPSFHTSFTVSLSPILSILYTCTAFGRDVTSDLGLQINKGDKIQFGMGKSNPNAAKGRERRGASKKKGKK
jgi:hypothetical protein